MSACFRLGVLPVAEHQQAQDRHLVVASTWNIALIALITFATRGIAFAVVLGSLALFGFGAPARFPSLDEGMRHLQGVPETCVAAIGQDINLELVEGKTRTNGCHHPCVSSCNIEYVYAAAS